MTKAQRKALANARRLAAEDHPLAQYLLGDADALDRSEAAFEAQVGADLAAMSDADLAAMREGKAVTVTRKRRAKR